MSPTETVTVRCHGAPARRSQWYGELARLVAAAPPPAAVVSELSSGDALPRLTVRPREIVDLLRRTLADASVRVEVGHARAPEPPPGLRWQRIGCVVRAGPPSDRAVEGGHDSVDRVGIPSETGPERWAGLQTFWVPGPRGTLLLARRFRCAARSPSDLDRQFRALGSAVAAAWTLQLGPAATFRRGPFGSRRDWRRGAFGSVPSEGWFERPAEGVARSVGAFETPGTDRLVETPAIVLGASGAGKTTYLARWATRAVEEGQALVVVDLHGDLAPAIVRRLRCADRRRVVAVDASLPPVPGVAPLVRDGAPDRAAAHLVAALKRLSPDGTELYWGFRLERIFDTFVRIALESGGTLTDLYDLLTNPDRRDAARLATRSAEIARFLDELATVVRRNPEFLWSAATRLSKVVLVPALRELLAPEEGGLPVERLLLEGRALCVRLPFASLGPEAASFAATLVLGRVYLGLAAEAERRGRAVPVSVVLDEVHALSPRLVAEILTEGRKFGLRVVVATQYPDRLSRELQSAARGALRGFVAFRVPPPSAAEVGEWLGLSALEAAALLPNLPTGEGLARDALSDGVSLAAPERAVPGNDPQPWTEAVDATRDAFAVGPSPPDPSGLAGDDATERLLLAVLAGVESGESVPRDGLAAAAAALPGSGPDGAVLADRVGTLFRSGYLEDGTDGLRLSAAGERRLGLTAATGATSESAEHRALLLTVFRHFARRGYRLEILRQGRFDTTLPDARFRQLPDRGSRTVPADLARAMERARAGWAWRFFHGRDVHVEAEVSGALRPERVRHGVRKALLRGAFILFVVGDAHRARRVRSVLRTMGLGVDRAQVWTLSGARIAADRPRTVNT